LKKANIHDVAALAGVSIKTVSRVINKEPNVKQNTQEKVQQAIESLNYRPNTSARSLAGHQSYLIAFLYVDPSWYENPSPNYVIIFNKAHFAFVNLKLTTY